MFTQNDMHSFLAAKGGGKREGAKGFRGRTNPKGRDGNIMHVAFAIATNIFGPHARVINIEIAAEAPDLPALDFQVSPTYQPQGIKFPRHKARIMQLVETLEAKPATIHHRGVISPEISLRPHKKSSRTF